MSSWPNPNMSAKVPRYTWQPVSSNNLSYNNSMSYRRSSSRPDNFAQEIEVTGEIRAKLGYPQRKAPTAPFLKGPIPLSLLQRAAQLPGKSSAVYQALWFLVGLKRNQNVKLPSNLLTEFGVSSGAKSRALHALERAGLVRVCRRPGCSAEVEVLTPAETAKEGPVMAPQTSHII
jgi:hypothetical protein